MKQTLFTLFVSETVDTHALPTGIYFVKIAPEGAEATVQRVVVAKSSRLLIG